MHSDHYYEIGTTHVACEDYASSGTRDGLAWAIVSDGCSSSRHTDVGARILAHAAESTLVNMHDREDLLETSFMDEAFSDVFYKVLLSKADTARNCLGLNYDALDATLLMAYVENLKDSAPVWGVITIGDGDVLLKYPEGDIRRMQVRYESNAPYYPSYNLCKDKDDGYKRTFSFEKRRTISWRRFGTDSDGYVQELSQVLDAKKDPFSEISGQVKGWTEERLPAQIIVTSDGIDSYEKNGASLTSFEGSELMPTLGMTDYKGLVGQFVQRRMKAFKKSCTKVGITHYDDVSCAAITLVE